MREFKDYLSTSENYQGPTSPQALQEDREAILNFASSREDLVTEFERLIHSDDYSDWIELASKHGVKYYIERRRAKKDYYGRMLLDPDIQPRIWGDTNGKVAVIKVTM